MQIEKFDRLIEAVSQMYDDIEHLTADDLNHLQRDKMINTLDTLSRALGACKDMIDFILRVIKEK